MRAFILKFLYFIGPFFFIYLALSIFILPALIEKTEGPSTETQIKRSFHGARNRNFDLLILGNSGMYRGINPDSMTIPAFNFAHDNDSFNQMYYKLLWLESQGKKIKFLVLGIDYFQFSFLSETRNYIYSSILSPDYSKDYVTNNSLSLILSRTNLLEFNRIKYVFNIFRTDQTLIFLKDNGQYIKPGLATKNDKYFYSINRLPIQKKYMEKILQYCSMNKIHVFLCMLPTRKNALLNYQEQEIKEFNEFIRSYTNENIHYLNYYNQPGWDLKDYTDITHLNEEAANRFTRQLNDTINTLLQVRPEVLNVLNTD